MRLSIVQICNTAVTVKLQSSFAWRPCTLRSRRASKLCPCSAVDELKEEHMLHRQVTCYTFECCMQESLVVWQLTCTSQRTRSPALKALLGISAVYRFSPAEATPQYVCLPHTYMATLQLSDAAWQSENTVTMRLYLVFDCITCGSTPSTMHSACRLNQQQ